MNHLKARLDELTSLQAGWDGYTGQSVSFNCAQFAINLIEQLYVNGVPAPQLVPGSDGTVQIEWHINQYNIEIDVLAPFDVIASRYDLTTNTEEEIFVKTDFTELSSWVAKLKNKRSKIK